MRTIYKSRLLSLVGAAALVAATITAIPANAAAVGPICDGKVPVQTCTGLTSDGAPYAMMVPANFNGMVALYSHGYRYNIDIPVGIPIVGGYKITNTPEPIPGGNPTVANYFLSQGMAVMGSGFARQGWNLDSAIATNVELIDTFKKKFTTTTKVVAWGSSLGGIITQTLAEKHPELVSAVAPMCMADNITPELTMAGDFLWGLKTFFDPTIVGGNYAAGAAGNAQAIGDIVKVLTVMGAIQAGIAKPVAADSWPATSSPGGKALGAAGIPARSAILMVGLMSGIPTQSAHFDATSGPEGALKLSFPLAISPALAILENGANAAILGILATQDLELQAGGAVFDNTKTDYAARVADSSVIFNAALSGNTAIAGLLGVLAASPRATGNPAAMAKMGTLAATTGKINVPTIMMTGVADPITPAGAQQRIVDLYVEQYAAEKEAVRKAAGGNGSYRAPNKKLLAIWSVTPASWTTFDKNGSPITSTPAAPGTNHCNFTTANLLTVAKFMVEAGSSGKLNWDAAARRSVRASKGLLVDPEFSAPLLKYYGN
jgi:pimeloyl-ACP methyl ester carboxylesterase